MPLTVAASPYFLEFERRDSYAHGGGDGVLRNVDGEGEFSVTDPLSLSINVAAFRGYAGGRHARLRESVETDAITAPTGGSAGDLRRIDTVQWTRGTGVNIKTGADSATPSAPSVDSGSIKLGQIHCRKGMTTIKAADDASNGWFTETGKAWL